MCRSGKPSRCSGRVRPNAPVGKAKPVFQRGAAQCAGRESQVGVPEGCGSMRQPGIAGCANGGTGEQKAGV